MCYTYIMNRFTRVYIIGVGFLSGLFIGIGVNPEAEIIKAFLEIIEAYSPGLAILLKVILILLGLYGTIQSWKSAYKRRGLLGIIAVALAFLGGLLLGLNIATGIWLLIVAILIGIFILR